MTVQLPQLHEGVLPEAQRLVAAFENLSTFEQVNEWDTRATYVIGALADHSSALGQWSAWANVELAKELAAYEALPFYRKWSTNRVERDLLRAAYQNATQQAMHLKGIIDNLDSLIAMSPNDEDNLVEMIEALKHHKKDLQLDLKEVKASMRDARASARGARAALGNSVTKFGRSLDRSSRFRIRLELESTLQTGESEAGAIERQLMMIERRLQWLDRFKAGLAKRRRK